MRPSDAIWWHKSMSTLAQVMAWCLTAPSHYLNQCWLIISRVLPRAISYELLKNQILEVSLKIARLKSIHSPFSRGHQWVRQNKAPSCCAILVYTDYTNQSIAAWYYQRRDMCAMANSKKHEDYALLSICEGIHQSLMDSHTKDQWRIKRVMSWCHPGNQSWKRSV